MNLKSWNDADRAMEALAAADAALRRAIAKRDEALAKVAADHNEAIARPEGDATELSTALKKFAQAHKVEFKPAPSGDGRSYEHANVTLGFRKRPDKVDIPPDRYEQIVEDLHNDYNDAYVRVRKEANLEAIEATLRAGHPTDQQYLGSLGISMKPGKDKFFLEVNQEA
jgi:phage host-nuclease inhibitor protein Gam